MLLSRILVLAVCYFLSPSNNSAIETTVQSKKQKIMSFFKKLFRSTASPMQDKDAAKTPEQRLEKLGKKYLFLQFCRGQSVDH